MTAIVRLLGGIALPLLLVAATARAQDPATGERPSEPPGASAPMAPSGWPSRGRLGVEVMPMTPELRAYFQAPTDRGILVVRVAKGRPAERGGLQVGDVLLSAAGEPLERPHDLVAVVARAPTDQKLALELVRKSETLTVDVAPDGEPIPTEAIEAWHGLGRMGEHLMRGMNEGTDQVLRRLDEIERRLERMEGERTGDR